MMIIYEIVCNITGERYIGSTKQPLKYRLNQHKRTDDPSRKHYCSSKQIILRGDYQANILEEGDIGKEREQHYLDILPNINRIRANGWRSRDTEKRRIYMKKFQKEYRKYRKSWGGDGRHGENNLLMISVDLFK